MKEFLKEGLEKLGIKISEDSFENLLKYLKILVTYNSHTNLTAIRDEKGILEKHFIDSLLVHQLLNENDKTAIDIGTGAGFPGMVLAICNPKIQFTLMDSVGKKTNFLNIVKEELGLKNVTVVNARAEEFINDENRETYSVGLCRGVSKLPTILEYMIPFLEIEGRFLVQKSPDTGEEFQAENALKILKSEITKEYSLKLPFCQDLRKIILITKKGSTDKKYPRKIGIPLKKPL